MSWQDKALAAFWADAFANEPLDSHRRMEAAIAAAAASLLPPTDAPMADNAITPPPELFKQWEDDILNERDNVDHVLDCAWRHGFHAGADQELEACCEWMRNAPFGLGLNTSNNQLRAARRPKPPSLNEVALKGPSDEELAECYRKAYYAHKDRQGPAAQVAALRAVLAKWGRQ